MTRHRRRVTALWVALVCWAVATLWLSSLRPDELPDEAFVFWDKANHFAWFTIGGLLAAGALRLSAARAGMATVAVTTVVALAAFGALDEMLQTFTPGRTGGDVRDWTADVLGALAGALLMLLASARLRQRQDDRIS